MNLILPKHLLVRRRFKCDKCGFAYTRETPSQVDKCPMCERNGVVSRVYERGVDKNNLNPLSRAKERWYADPSGKGHLDEISRRKKVHRKGKDITVVTDSKGREIEELYDAPVRKKDVKIKRYEA